MVSGSNTVSEGLNSLGLPVLAITVPFFGIVSTSAASMEYHLDQGPEAAECASVLMQPSDFAVGDDVAWMEVVSEVTRDHRPMERWEREVTSDIIESLFD